MADGRLAEPPLAEGTCLVWRIEVPPGAAAPADLAALGEEERAAARAIVDPDARRTFVAARAALRRILGARLGLAPDRVPLGREPGGRPRLGGSAGDSPLRFSVSHSGRRALVALARDVRVGVDLERLRPGVDADALARRILEPRALAAFRDAPAAARRTRFFVLWCAFEAVMKARGIGVFDAEAEPLPLVLDAAGSPRLDGEAGRGWRLHEIPAGRGYRAVLALGSQAPFRVLVLPAGRSPRRRRVP